MSVPLAAFITCVAAWVFLYLVRPQSAAKAEFERWAEESQMSVVRVHRRPKTRGPFADVPSGVVFQIEVRAHDGGTRTGWFRFGDGLFRPEAPPSEVVWDDGGPGGPTQD